MSGEGLVERLRTGDPRKCPFPDIDLEAAQPCPVCGDMGTLPGDPGHVDAPVRCVERNNRLLIDEAADALTTAEALIQELEAALDLALEWLPCVEGHLRDSNGFKRDIAKIRTLRGE